MYIILEYATCIGVTLVIASVSFASYAALLVVQEGVLALGGIICAIVQRRREPALLPAMRRTPQRT